MSEGETVVAYFNNPSEAEKAVNRLIDSGFSREHTGFVSSSPYPGSGSEANLHEKDKDTPTEGMWDRIVHFFEGDSSSNDRQPHGADMEEDDTAGEYEYGHEEWSGSLGSMGLSRERSRYFEQQLNNGQEGALITVQAGDRRQEAEQILRWCGGDLGDNAANFQTPERSGTREQASGSEGQERQHVQLLGEVLRVHKERIARGEVRLRKEVVTENQTIQVPVSREELIIERTAGSGTAASGETIGQEKEIRIPLSEERVQVEKRPVVREEVEIRKRRVEETKEVGDQVRHEELRVDKDENVKVDDRSKGKKRIA